MTNLPRTILVVDDDPRIRDMLRLSLVGAGYRVLETDRVDCALAIFRRELPDLAILDINLPDGTGIELCEKLRAHPAKGGVPVIVLTAHEGIELKTQGVSAGADQYLVKPVSLREVLLWVSALLKRAAGGAPADPDLLCAGALTIDAKSHIVRVGDQLISSLTGREFDLLLALIKSRPRILSRHDILSRVWKTVATDKVVDVHIKNLREKLPDETRHKIQSVPGRGFRYLD